MTHPRAEAARLTRRNEIKAAARASGLTQAECRELRELQLSRARRAGFVDPLLRAGRTRAGRTATRQAEARARLAAMHAEAEADRLAEALRIERRAAVRAGLLAAARLARKLGYDVRASRGRDRRVSSYYCRKGAGPAIRLSDHAIPESPRRLDAALAHGRFGYDGYRGPEILLDRPRSATWLRRSFLLREAGR